MRMPVWLLLLVAGALFGCEEPKQTRYKRAMRQIDRAHLALGEGLKPEKIRDVAATKVALDGKAEIIATEVSRPEVTSYIDNDDFRKFAQVLGEDAAALEAAIDEGRLEEAMDVLFPRIDSTCELCHSQFKKTKTD